MHDWQDWPLKSRGWILVNPGFNFLLLRCVNCYLGQVFNIDYSKIHYYISQEEDLNYQGTTNCRELQLKYLLA